MATKVPTLSPSEPFVDRYRRITSRWYPWMKQLFDSLRETEEALTSVTETFDQVGQSWSVQINNDQHVLGLVRLDAEVAITTFTVVADKFIIANPTDGTDTKQMFVVGLVDGTPTVGINGNLIVDETIVARHIDVSTLSAISANIGTVTAGVIQSADGKMVINLNTGTLSITA